MGSAVVLAVVIGGAIAVQVATIGRVADRFHVLAVSLVLQLSGLVAGLTWAVLRSGWEEVAAIMRLWWWVPLGALGWMLVGGLGFATARVGVATTLSLALASQLVVGLAIDAASGTRVGVRALLGVLLLVGGTVLVTTRS